MMTQDKRLAIVEQLALGFTTAIGWISDGSGDKAYFGKLVGVELGNRGLILIVSSGERLIRVSWRMHKHDASFIVDMFASTVIYFRSPSAIPFVAYVAKSATRELFFSVVVERYATILLLLAA